MPATYSTEERLVLDCACAEISAASAERIRTAAMGGVDWVRVRELAERHRVTPILLKTLESVSPEALLHPDAVLLRSRARFIAARTLQLTRELLSLVKNLENKGILTIPLKGSVLAMKAFGSLSSREFADIDLLVRREDVSRGCSVLDAAGYRRDLDLPPRQLAAYLRSEHALTYHRQQERLTVELHWRLHDRYLAFPLSEKLLWSNVEVENTLGTQLRCMKPEYEFLFLCMHGAKHSWERLEWISCLHALTLRQPASRWPAIISAAARLRSTRLLHLALTLADNLSSCEATRKALALLKPDPKVEDLATTVWNRMFAVEITGSAREVYRFRFYLKAREHLWDRMIVVWNLAVRIPHPQSSAWEKSSLPPSLTFMHYFLGPLTFFRKFGLRGLSGVFRPQQTMQGSADAAVRRRL